MQTQARRPSLCLFCAFASKSKSNLAPSSSKLLVARRSISRFRKVHAPPIDAVEQSLGKALYNGKYEIGRAANSQRGIGDWRRQSMRRQSHRPLLSEPRSLKDVLKGKLPILKNRLSQPNLLQSLDLDENKFRKTWNSFENYVLSFDYRSEQAPELEALAQVYKDKGPDALLQRLTYAFYGHALGSRFTRAELDNQKGLADLSHPSEWFPATRQIQRKIHLHVGPTNSGKTYHALQRLQQAETGVYLGPLRLLAHEIYTRLNAQGKRCALVTGDDRRMPDGKTTMFSCTVEMAPFNHEFDVAVIDEIQMINSSERGWAWTQALLGLKAKELHLCGEERTVDIIRELCAINGDTLEIHNYKRLSPLQLASGSLGGSLDKLEKGDCIVSFSVLGIHDLRKKIETKTGRKVAVIYGSLPPETRAQQARLFNDTDNEYDFLVASDAIGMGLNLSIKRIIFETTVKNNGTKMMPLQIPEVKQIAGRAGRYRTAEQANKEATQTATQAKSESVNDEPSDHALGAFVDLDDAGSTSQDKVEDIFPVRRTPENDNSKTIGIVTSLEHYDFRHVKRAMEREAEPIKTAGIFPPGIIVERFASYFPPGAPLSYILLRLHEIARTSQRFHLCNLRDQLKIADIIHLVKGLTINDRLIFCAAPTSCRTPRERELLVALAKAVGEQRTCDLLDLPELNLDVLDQEFSKSRAYLADLEILHKSLVLYLWLSFRFSGVFTTRALATYTKELVEARIENCLAYFSFSDDQQKKLRARRESFARRTLSQPEQNLDDSVRRSERRDNAEGDTSAIKNSIEPASQARKAVKEVLLDKESFEEDDVDTQDDMGEYPTSELGELKTEQNSSATDKHLASLKHTEETGCGSEEPSEQAEHSANRLSGTKDGGHADIDFNTESHSQRGPRAFM